jgi:hypothetical protein
MQVISDGLRFLVDRRWQTLDALDRRKESLAAAAAAYSDKPNYNAIK